MTAREGSILKASQVLGLTQPAITKSIRILEDQVNAPLFIRHTKGVTLTPQGRLLSEFCEALFLRMRDLEKQFSSRDAGLSGIIRIGTYETLGESFWPPALKKISKDFPELVVELTTEEPEQHWRKLESGALDIIVDAEPRISDQFYSRVLYTDLFGVFCKKNSSLISEQTEVPIAYVKKAVDQRNISVAQHLTRVSTKFDLRFAMESFTMVRSLTIEGVCVGALPLRLAEKFLKSGALVPFPAGKNLERFGEHRICATCLYDLRNDPRIAKISALLRSASSGIKD